MDVLDALTDPNIGPYLRWFGLVLGVFATWLVVRVVHWFETRA